MLGIVTLKPSVSHLYGRWQGASTYIISFDFSKQPCEVGSLPLILTVFHKQRNSSRRGYEDEQHQVTWLWKEDAGKMSRLLGPWVCASHSALQPYLFMEDPNGRLESFILVWIVNRNNQASTREAELVWDLPQATGLCNDGHCLSSAGVCGAGSQERKVMSISEPQKHENKLGVSELREGVGPLLKGFQLIVRSTGIVFLLTN